MPSVSLEPLAEAERVVREVAAAVGLFEAEAGVRAVLAALARLEPVSTRRLSRAVALPVPIVASVCGELRKRGVVADERPAQLTAVGRRLFAAGELRLERRARCPSCAGRAVVIPPGLTRVVRAIARDAAHAPRVRLELDQCHCTVETKLRRVLAIHDAGALTGRRILFLGDDDLTSLALRRLVDEIGSESTIEHVGVVDIDPAIVAFVERRLASSGFPVSFLEHDLRSSLPRGWAGAFDTVVTDPPYTVEGARVFLSRAAEAIGAARGDVFFSFGSMRPGASLRVQQAIVRMGFTIESLSRDFNEYVGAGVLAGASHLYHLRTGGEHRPLVAERSSAPLYTGSSRL